MTTPTSRKAAEDPPVMPIRCRGCGRPLASAVSLLAGYGPRCAGRRWKAQNDNSSVASAMLAAVAMVTADLQSFDVGSVDLMDDVDPAVVIRCLSVLAARLMMFHPEPGLQRLAAVAVTGLEDTR